MKDNSAPGVFYTIGADLPKKGGMYINLKLEMQAYATAFKLMKLQAHGTTCKFIELYASSLNWSHFSQFIVEPKLEVPKSQIPNSRPKGLGLTLKKLLSMKECSGKKVLTSNGQGQKKPLPKLFCTNSNLINLPKQFCTNSNLIKGKIPVLGLDIVERKV